MADCGKTWKHAIGANTKSTCEAHIGEEDPLDAAWRVAHDPCLPGSEGDADMMELGLEHRSIVNHEGPGLCFAWSDDRTGSLAAGRGHKRGANHRAQE